MLLCLYDSIDFPACFLGAIKAGIVPVPINTMWSAADYAYVLQRQSRASGRRLRSAAAGDGGGGTDQRMDRDMIVVAGHDEQRRICELSA